MVNVLRKENKLAGRALAVMKYMGLCPNLTPKFIKEDDYKLCLEALDFIPNDNSWISNILNIWRSYYDLNGPKRFFVDDIWASYLEAYDYIVLVDKVRNLSNSFLNLVTCTENIKKAMEGETLLNDKTKNSFLIAFDFPEEIQASVFVRTALLFNDRIILNNLAPDARCFKSMVIYKQAEMYINEDIEVF